MTNLTDGTSNTIIIAETRWGMNASRRTRIIFTALGPDHHVGRWRQRVQFRQRSNRHELGRDCGYLKRKSNRR